MIDKLIKILEKLLDCLTMSPFTSTGKTKRSLFLVLKAIVNVFTLYIKPLCISKKVLKKSCFYSFYQHAAIIPTYVYF